MPILAKITPDYLRDTIVELRYQSELPYDILKGLLYNMLKEEGLDLISNINPLGVIQLGPQHQFKLGGSPTLDFADDEIKIQLNDNGIIFNSLNSYPGWKRYFPKIQTITGKLSSSAYINGFDRIGIRYISEFPEIAIFDHLNVRVDFSFSEASAFNTAIRTELEEEGARVVINLANNMRRQAPQQNERISIIDIDVIGIIPPDLNPGEVFDQIDRLHTIEKKVFLNLLKPEFLKTLNPEFE